MADDQGRGRTRLSQRPEHAERHRAVALSLRRCQVPAEALVDGGLGAEPALGESGHTHDGQHRPQSGEAGSAQHQSGGLQAALVGAHEHTRHAVQPPTEGTPGGQRCTAPVVGQGQLRSARASAFPVVEGLGVAQQAPGAQELA
jgi:hypothetical protein